MKKTFNIAWYFVFFILFPVLFYKQGIGLNAFIYSVSLILFWISAFPVKSKSSTGFLWLLANIIAAVSVAIYGNSLSIICLLFTVASTSIFFNQNNVNPLSSIYASFKTFVLSPFTINSQLRLKQTSRFNIQKAFLYIIIPATILLTFTALYTMSDQVFSELLKKIDFNIFNFQFIITMLIGILVIYSITHNQVSKKRARLERLAGKKASTKDRFPLHFIPKQSENITGIITLTMLNFLIFMVIANDLLRRVIEKGSTVSMTHYAYLHQGIFALVISIVFAILIIVWLFRTKSHKNKVLKNLAMAWMGQNLVLVALNMFRNHLYIQSFSLTYKRIGVYIYLLAAAIGIILTIIYIFKEYHFLQLVKMTSYAFMGILILSSPVPWDHFITHYNVDQSIKNDKLFDYDYILSLKNADLNYVYQKRSELLDWYQAENLEANLMRRNRIEDRTKLLSKTLYQSNQKSSFKHLLTEKE